MRHKNLYPDYLTIPRRVLMTADTLSGVWAVALELTRALGRYGVEVALATMGRPLSVEQKMEAETIPSLRVFESQYKLEWMEDPWEDVARAGDWLLDLERQIAPDLVHLNGYAHGALPWNSPVVAVGHSCVLSWWEAVRGGNAPDQWNRYRGAVTAGLRAADLVVAPSQTMLGKLEELYGPFAATEVILNGRQLPGLKWQTKEELVLTAGRWGDEAKNLAALASIAPRLPWPIYLAGEERHPAGQTTPMEGLQCLGPLAPEELAGWYAKAAIYALPARYEPFGLSALEAGLADCALVLGDIPSLREVWGRAAVFVPPDDPEALQRAITSLMLDWRKLIGLGVRARNRAQELTPLRMAAAYVAAYGLVLEQARARRKEELACAS